MFKFLARRGGADARPREICRENEGAAVFIDGQPPLFQPRLCKPQLAFERVDERGAVLFEVFHAVLDARHHEVRRARGAEELQPCRRTRGERVVRRGAHVEQGALREGGHGLVRTVHPEVGVLPRIGVRLVGIEAQVRAVRAVNEQRLAVPPARGGDARKVCDIPVIIGRSYQNGANVALFLQRRLYIRGGRWEQDALLFSPAQEQRLDAEDGAGGKDALVRIARGDQLGAAAAHRPQHRIDAAGGAVR